jgi:predicted nucleic acid-binding protein
MSAILDYSSAISVEFAAFSQGIRRMCLFPWDATFLVRFLDLHERNASGKRSILSRRRFPADAPLCLSAVVLEEPYAAASGRVRQSLARRERDFDRVKRILVPTLGDRTQAGRVLARLAARHGYEKIGQGGLANDALIAMSAARVDATVITANERGFARLAEFRPFQRQAAIL